MRAAPYFTSVTGTAAKWITFVVTEPSSSPRMRPRPRVPMMISAHLARRAKPVMTSAGSPIRK
jgi:hypothetical protein